MIKRNQNQEASFNYGYGEQNTKMETSSFETSTPKKNMDYECEDCSDKSECVDCIVAGDGRT